MPHRVRAIFDAASARLASDSTGIITVAHPSAWDLIDLMHSGSGFCVRVGDQRIALPQAIDAEYQATGLFPYVVSVIHDLAIKEARATVRASRYTNAMEAVAWAMGASKSAPSPGGLRDPMAFAEAALQQARGNLQKPEALSNYVDIVCDALDVDGLMVTTLVSITDVSQNVLQDLKRMHRIKRLIPLVLCPMPVVAEHLTSASYQSLDFRE